VHGLTTGRDEHDELRDAVARVLATETDPVRQVAAAVQLAADDAEAGWRSLADDLGRAGAVADDRRVRALRKAQTKAGQLAKTAAALRRDVERLLAATEVDR
jgi:hypothetical protein